ncbi:hypothetical protein QEN19_001821 [Hanseniaspora menglaensis]
MTDEELKNESLDNIADDEDDLFVFDDLNNYTNINEYTEFLPLPAGKDKNLLTTLQLEEDLLSKLNDNVLLKNDVIKLNKIVDENDYNIIEPDPLDDLYYECHHKRLRKLEVYDHVLNADEIKEYLLELEEHLDTLNRDFNIKENIHLNKITGVRSTYRDVIKTLCSICKIHDPHDSKELSDKRIKCIAHINQMIKNYKYSQFKRLFIIKKKFNNTLKSYVFIKPLALYSYMNINKHNDLIKQGELNKKPSIYNSIDKKYIYDDVNKIQENIDNDTETDIEEDCMVLNMATVDDIKKKRLKQLNSDTGITYGVLKLNSIGKEIVIEPFTKPYIK